MNWTELCEQGIEVNMLVWDCRNEALFREGRIATLEDISNGIFIDFEGPSVVWEDGGTEAFLYEQFTSATDEEGNYFLIVAD